MTSRFLLFSLCKGLYILATFPKLVLKNLLILIYLELFLAYNFRNEEIQNSLSRI